MENCWEIDHKIRPSFQELVPEIQKLLKDKSYLKSVLKKGSEKANIIAEENLKNIRAKVGLI